ncbi:hypothetical protein DSO57_1022250 [Entomophthora muscae]|uniref:Uncharacterized protein n=1 Tax=Entomophthora muscae TaxID=34485 RepID=A0ACC2UN28_9FUNG|nr:hypothetical protein DSO57_1022250 [Entomophthora muscae]
MKYQPGSDPVMGGISYNSPAPPIPQPYNHSRAGMVILTILSLAEVVIPNLGAYRPLAVGLLYLTCSALFLYWALVTCYTDELSSPLMPLYMTAPGHDSLSVYNLGNLSPYILMSIGASCMLLFSIIAYCIYRLNKEQPTTVVESNNPSSPAQIQTVTVSTSKSNSTTNCALPNIQKMNHADVRKGLDLLGAHFKAFPAQYSNEAHKVLTVGSMLTGDTLEWFTSALKDNEDLCLNFDEFKTRLLEATTPKGTQIQDLLKLLSLEQRSTPLEEYIV